MDVILVLLLVAAWGVFVLPSLAGARRAKSPAVRQTASAPVEADTVAASDSEAPAKAEVEAGAEPESLEQIESDESESPGQAEREKPVNRETTPQTARRATESASSREQVLARRRLALIVLAVLAIATLAAAIITGSWPILAASLVIDVLLAAYIAVLLQIKQNKATAPPPRPDEEDVRVF